MSRKSLQRSQQSNDADKWLNNFSSHVDYRRFERGVALFNEERIESFEWTKTGYQATVLGSRQSPYSVVADFELVDKFPDFHLYKPHCSCPDDARYCKHSVCTTLYMILVLDRFMTKPTETLSLSLDFSKARLLDKLEDAAKKLPHRIDTL